MVAFHTLLLELGLNGDDGKENGNCYNGLYKV